jgi:hypothetical protein
VVVGGIGILERFCECGCGWGRVVVSRFLPSFAFPLNPCTRFIGSDEKYIVDTGKWQPKPFLNLKHFTILPIQRGHLCHQGKATLPLWKKHKDLISFTTLFN